MELGNINKKITELKQLQQRIPGLISTLNREIASLERTIVDKSRRKVSLQDNLRSKSRQLSQLRSSLSSKSRVLAQQKNTLAAEQRKLSSIRTAHQSVLTRLSRLEQEIVTNVNRIKFLEARIPELQRINSSIRFQVNELTDERNRNSRVIAQIQRTIDDFNEELNYQQRELGRIELALTGNRRDLESINRTIIDVTQQRDSRYENYQRYLSDARVIGRQAGESLSVAEAQRSGQRDSVTDAEENARVYGKKIGLLSGFVKGLVDGANSGKVDGLRDGRADESSYQNGVTRGYQIGVSMAEDKAKKVVYPGVYRNFRQELLGSLKNFFNGVGEDSSKDEAKDDRNGSPAQGVDEYIRQNKAELTRLELPSVRYSEASYAYTAPRFSIPNVGRECDDVYSYIEFRRACEREFESGYEQSYLGAHRQEYFQEYARYYEPSL